MTNSQFLNFFIELIKRFRNKSPKFFNILSYVMLAAFVLTGLPGFLEDTFKIVLPEWADVLANKVLGWVTFALAIGFQLPADSPVVTTSVSGTPLKATDETKLPFTAKSDQAAADKL